MGCTVGDFAEVRYALFAPANARSLQCKRKCRPGGPARGDSFYRSSALRRNRARAAEVVEDAADVRDAGDVMEGGDLVGRESGLDHRLALVHGHNGADFPDGRGNIVEAVGVYVVL